MVGYVIISIVSGLLFGFMDVLIQGNPLAQKCFECYRPIAKTSINVPAGIVADLVYGFVMAGIFLLLYKSLPGATGLVKGVSFGLIAWFFRVVMHAVSQWMVFTVPMSTLLYVTVTGFGEMIVLGILYGVTLHPTAS